jgi:hypothetical protein
LGELQRQHLLLTVSQLKGGERSSPHAKALLVILYELASIRLCAGLTIMVASGALSAAATRFAAVSIDAS